MKKLWLISLVALTLFGCSTTASSEKESSQEAESSIAKNELEKIGLTYGQSIDFDEYVAAVSENIEGLQDFNFEVMNNYESLTPTSTADILINTYSIETAYLNNGGKKQDAMVNFLQGGITGFFQISESMYEHQREYTLTEAYGCLKTLLSFTEEIGISHNLDDSDIKTLQKYFLNSINTKGDFIEAAETLLNEL